MPFRIGDSGHEGRVLPKHGQPVHRSRRARRRREGRGLTARRPAATGVTLSPAARGTGAPPSLSRTLRAKTSTRAQIQCHPRESPAGFQQGRLVTSIVAMKPTRLRRLSAPYLCRPSGGAAASLPHSCVRSAKGRRSAAGPAARAQPPWECSWLWNRATVDQKRGTTWSPH